MGNSLKKHMNISQIESEIREHPVVIYTKSMCAYCKRAKDLLTAVNVAYEEKNLDSMQADSPDIYQSYVNGLVYLTRQTSVPQIFICGKFIGGFSDLEQLKKADKLFELINECSTMKLDA
ncbi:unnamed protein product [Dracunculus medinensis]|uniref:Glutaredoxin domain-containing protein n=1 Tax=Dracunculus medinensis TaxID=318479 RepID=A0A0N4UEM6_DRAME|nr:unnamed protein product [Dracunculus medinensis]